jgi:hypothetical protein
MGLLADYRKKRLERRRKRDEARADALKSMQDEPIVRHGYDRMTDPSGAYHSDKGRDIRG